MVREEEGLTMTRADPCECFSRSHVHQFYLTYSHIELQNSSLYKHDHSYNYESSILVVAIHMSDRD